jgi:acyl carrier protein
METRERIAAFLTKTFYGPGAARLGDDASLVESGLVDSTGVLEVISFIEGQFGVTVADHEIVPENLDSIARIAAFVEKKQASAARAAE